MSNFLAIGLFWLVPCTYVWAQADQAPIPRGLRQHILQYQGVQPVWGGPNCWNLALSATGIIPALRNSTPEEMSFFMESPLYQDIEKQFVTPQTETDYFQCQSMQNYFEQHGEIPEKLKSASNTLDRFEEHLQAQSFMAKRLSPLAKDIWFKFAAELKDYLATERSFKNDSADANSFIVSAIKIRLQSISNHLLVTGYDRNFTQEIDRVRNEIR